MEKDPRAGIRLSKRGRRIRNCSCDLERKKQGWYDAGCKLHGLEPAHLALWYEDRELRKWLAIMRMFGTGKS